MEKVLKDVQDALSKTTIAVGWVERSATHQDRGEDRARIEPDFANVRGRKHGNGKPLVSDGGLHPMALTFS